MIPEANKQDQDVSQTVTPSNQVQDPAPQSSPISSVPAVSSVSVTSQPVTSSVPVTTSLPAVPAMPSMSSMSSMPSMPSVPSVPSIPSMPSVPSVPSMPSMTSMDPNQMAIYQQMLMLYQQMMMMMNMTSVQTAAIPTPAATPETIDPSTGENAGYYNMFGTMDPNLYNYYTQMMYQMMQNPMSFQQQSTMYMQNPMLSMLMNPTTTNTSSIPSIPQRKPEEYTEDPPEECKLFVGGMPPEVNDVILKNYFQQFGPVRNVTVVRNRETGLSRGFGFVEFRSRVVC